MSCSAISQHYSQAHKDLPLWKRGIKGDFMDKFNQIISPAPAYRTGRPSLLKRGMRILCIAKQKIDLQKVHPFFEIQ
jgi:hypothetical protein